jgi:hypothetical protein
MLKQAIVYAKGEEGLVPQSHIDHIYKQVYWYIKGEGTDKKEQGNNRKSGKAGKSRRNYKKHKYARTQDLYKRTQDCWLNIYETTQIGLTPPMLSQRKKKYLECSKDYGGGETPQVPQPFSRMVPEIMEGRDLMYIIPEITTKEVAARIARMKRDTAAGPDGILKKQVTQPVNGNNSDLLSTRCTGCLDENHRFH